jgi:hypothetical protein
VWLINETGMKTRNLFALALLTCFNFFSSRVFSQSSEDLMGRWEGVHYYGDTTRLIDGTLLVRASTIDSMRMVLTIEQLPEGKFRGKLHEHFYSDPSGRYFTADVSGFINDEKIHFTSFEIKDKKMPAGNRWCQPKATGVIVRNETIFFLNMFFETSLTCTIGPAILEKKISPNIETTIPAIVQNKVELDKIEAVIPTAPYNPQFSSIEQNFKKRHQSVISTINVQSDTIKVNFVDNGTVDGDSISVFVNGKLAASHVRLTTTAFTMNVHFENGMEEIEVAMFAENLGTLPPNTALMQITDGRKIHKAYLKGDTTSNAVIKLRRVK